MFINLLTDIQIDRQTQKERKVERERERERNVIQNRSQVAYMNTFEWKPAYAG